MTRPTHTVFQGVEVEQLALVDEHIEAGYRCIERLRAMTRRAAALGLNTETVDASVDDIVRSLVALLRTRRLIEASLSGMTSDLLAPPRQASVSRPPVS